MGLNVKVGNFNMNTATGHQSVTGIGFVPKVVIFIQTHKTAPALGPDANLGIGIGISSSLRGCMSANDKNGQATSDSASSTHNAKCIQIVKPGGLLSRYEADFVSQDADGFTIDVTIAPPNNFKVGYMAIGGDDLTNVDTDFLQSINGTGNQSITGLGFKPDALIFFSQGSTTAPPNTSDDLNYSIGLAVSPSQEGWSSTVSKSGQATTDTARQQRTDACIGILDNNGVLVKEAELVSMDSDGFTLNWLSGTGQFYVGFLALKGGQYFVGSFGTQTGTGNFSETGVGFQGSGAMFASFCNATDAGEVANCETSLGIAASSSERFIAGMVSEDNQSTSNTDQFQGLNKTYLNYDYLTALEGSNDFVSFDSDGITLNQTKADPSPNEVLFLVMGDAAPITSRVPYYYDKLLSGN